VKHTIDDLAIFGGSPAFSEKLFVGRPNIDGKERLLERINDLLDRKWLTNTGPYVEEFERRIADLVGTVHCIAMCHATVALEIAIGASGLRGEVIVASLTFIATSHALQWQAGATETGGGSKCRSTKAPFKDSSRHHGDTTHDHVIVIYENVSARNEPYNQFTCLSSVLWAASYN
jgi:hypothetical protein